MKGLEYRGLRFGIGSSGGLSSELRAFGVYVATLQQDLVKWVGDMKRYRVLHYDKV